jgi:nucleoside-diphosphate-sugar epimerase
MINLIHYDDAAVAAMSALTGSRRLRPSCKVILVSDGQPISRLDICKAALKNPLYAGSSIPNFKGDASLIDGKRYDTTMLRKELQWSAKFPNFTAFMENHVCSADEMQVPLLLC